MKICVLFMCMRRNMGSRGISLQLLYTVLVRSTLMCCHPCKRLLGTRFPPWCDRDLFALTLAPQILFMPG